jgi:formylglycine-generating enzyme required for sulfatase activity
MVLIPAGSFMMGFDQYEDEAPAHRVDLDAFYIDKYEVTNRRFERFVKATSHVTDLERGSVLPPGRWTWRRPLGEGTSYRELMDHPVVNVTWNDAVAFSRWAKKRLPTEAEWEKAARGTDARKFPWGNESAFVDGRPARANFGLVPWNPENRPFTKPVGSFPEGKSPYGVLDMAGNVAEWCSDWYDQNYYSRSPTLNPRGPSTGREHVTRGGEFETYESGLRCASRDGHPIGAPAFITVGFRCARSAR